MRQIALAGMSAIIALSGCGPSGKSYGPVSTREQAIEIAKAELGSSPMANGPFEVAHKGRNWTVKTERESDAAEFGIDERTGRVTWFSADVTEVTLIKPVK